MANEKDPRALQNEIQGKIKALIGEFSRGEISNHQFNVIYERYSTQLEMAIRVVDGVDASTPGSDISTFDIREATAGKAVGVAIYHHRSGTIVETLGQFELPPDVTGPILNEFSQKLDTHEFLQPLIRELMPGLWTVFMARSYTTAIVVFKNEPSQRQIRHLERLLHDFEEANRHLLDKASVDASKLAKPFLGFVRKKKDA